MMGISNSKYLNVAKCPAMFIYNSETFNQLFEHVKIQTNELCTKKCHFCYYGNIRKSKKRDVLPSKAVYKLLDELSKLNFSGRLGLFEINEPLTDHRIIDFVKYAAKKITKAWHMLITNGDLLTLDKLEKLFQAGLNQLCVSVYDQQSLEKINQMKNKKPEFFVKVEIMDLINCSSWDNRGGNINYKTSLSTQSCLNAPCERIYKLIYVRPSGNVVSCFCDFYEVNVMGNIYQSSLKEIWFGKRFKELRANLDKGNREVSPLCNYCDYPGAKGFFERPQERP